MKVTDLEKQLVPDSYRLKYEDDTLVSTILDEELDPIELSFHNDGCVEINTMDLSYVTLSVEHLLNLIELINEAEKVYAGEKSDILLKK